MKDFLNNLLKNAIIGGVVLLGILVMIAYVMLSIYAVAIGGFLGALDVIAVSLIIFSAIETVVKK